MSRAIEVLERDLENTKAYAKEAEGRAIQAARDAESAKADLETYAIRQKDLEAALKVLRRRAKA